MKSAALVALRLLGLLSLSLLGGWFLPMGATAAVPPHVGWTIRSIAQPTVFTTGNDRYTLLITNVGEAHSNGPVTISDMLPLGITPTNVEGSDLGTGNAFTCNLGLLRCIDESEVAPGDTLLVRVEVVVGEGITGNLTNSARVIGGEGSPASTSTATEFGSTPASFGIQSFNMQALDASGTQDTNAGDHPYTLVTGMDFNTSLSPEGRRTPIEEVKNIVVDLPLGLIGNPLAAAKCRLSDLLKSNGETLCPTNSRVGLAVLEVSGGGFAQSENLQDAVTALYNLVPESGYPAELGLTLDGVPAILYASVIHTNEGYAVRVSVPGTTELEIGGASLMFFGNPIQRDGGGTGSPPFFTNPANCASGPLSARLAVDSWQNPADWQEKTSTVYPVITNCNMLQFQPTLGVHPDTTRADEPSGYEVNVEVLQHESSLTPGTPELKSATVTLPPGVSASPSAADGLVGCAPEGPNGINIGGGFNAEGVSTTDPEATAAGPDGLPHLAPGHCPGASQIGTVEVTTPLLANPLEGRLFLAEPRCGGGGQPGCTPADATNGNLFGAYLEVAGSGVILKLAGKVSADPVTGQLTASFTENPQLPFSALKIRLKGGPRALLANPQTCGAAATASDITPWSSPITPDGTPLASFNVDWDGAGGGCPVTLPFAPGFLAQTQTPIGGGFSPFTMTISRGDREQNLSQLVVHTPVGLLGILAGIPLCQEPQASQGTCSPASQIGTTNVSAGAGSHPLWVAGQVYLTGPYKGNPFGLSIVVPAKAGPFNLGNVVVRASISADPHSSALTVTSDPLPQIIDGVPLRVQTVNVAIDRPGFMFNPTNCRHLAVTATLAGVQGASANVSTPFTATGCANLPFKPKFAVSTSAKTSKKNGASLHVKVASSAGQANIGGVAVSLPKQLPARLTTLQQACPAATFAANPATCPAGSLVGTAKAISPVLPVTLTGPAYLVSHGGAAFPDLVVILQGEGIRVDLTGGTSIKNGITSSTFASVPDVPIRSFELALPQGPHSALAGNGSLCAKPLTMPTTLNGQNGAQVKQTTKVSVVGCPKKAKIKVIKKGKK